MEQFLIYQKLLFSSSKRNFEVDSLGQMQPLHNTFGTSGTFIILLLILRYIFHPHGRNTVHSTSSSIIEVMF